MRTYTDPEGTVWVVYLVAPSGGASPQLLPADYRSGWICFDTADSKRRLAPIPPDWESCPESRLDSYREAAVTAPRRIIPTTEGHNAPAQGLAAHFQDVERAFTQRLPAALSVALDRLAEHMGQPDAPAALRAYSPLMRLAAQAATSGDFDTARKKYREAAAHLPVAVLGTTLEHPRT